MSRVGFFGSWKSQRYGFQLTFTRVFMACLFIAMMAFNAVMYVREELRFELFGFEDTWIYVSIVAELVILALLGFLSVPIQDNQELIAFLIPDYKGICTLVFPNTEHNSDTS